MDHRVNDDKDKNALSSANTPCFIEQQFPVAKVSMESYKERRGGSTQTLTGLGRWWGRKPLILVRTALLGLLMPTSDDPEKDREIFLKIMLMDSHGLYERKNKNIPGRRLVDELLTMPPSIQKRFLDQGVDAPKKRLRRLTPDDKEEVQQLVFNRMSYNEKLAYCERPENIEGPSKNSWNEINAHLGTSATNLVDLIHELGRRRFGDVPMVGDSFCGGGSIPFESARLGCDVYASDLNPFAALMTWASLNVVGGGDDIAQEVEDALQEVYGFVDKQIVEWGIEHNSLGWRADAYLYCVEVTDPESGWRIPLSPTWIIGKRTKTIAKLIPDAKNKRYDIEIIEGVEEDEIDATKAYSTVRSKKKTSRVFPPHGGPSTPVDVIRRNMRLWNAEDITPAPNDVFQERLYCIRWVETYIDENGREKTRRHYRAPTTEDIQRENRVLELLRERFFEWQTKGFIPSRKIVPGTKTDEPTRTRGWTHWHHLFTPRQLLLLGLFAQTIDKLNKSKQATALLLLAQNRLANYNSRLSRWDPSASKEMVLDVYANQALNTNYNFGSRGLSALDTTWFAPLEFFDIISNSNVLVELSDSRVVDTVCDIWMTDPPYADAVSYHELSEFFLAWYDRRLPSLFPDWYTDSKRALAVQGSSQSFRKSMVDCYKRITEKMPDNGLQIVMFTHQDASVWADLTMILWAAGLRVTAAWTIATETDSALKQGNYVQGTVLLVLRKRIETDAAFLDEIMPLVEMEVRQQLDSMLALEDDSDPNFGDADYQLAAYAAALRVLTAQPIEEIDPAREIMREQSSGGTSPVERLIRNAVKIACDHLVPKQFDANLWKRLAPMERFYLKGLEVESHGEYRNGVYQELARGFGAADYTDLLASTQANETRLKSPSEMGKKALGGNFNSSLVRQCLFAIYQVTKSEEAQDGLNWLKTEIPDYWEQRERIIHILDYLGRLEHVQAMKRWRKDGRFATLLAGNVRNDHV